MAATYTPIASITLGTATSSVTFSSIPQIYTDLICIVNNFSSTATGGNITYYFNSDNSSGLYSRTSLYGDGSTAASTRGTSSNLAYAGLNVPTIANSIINILNYANTSTFKTSLARGNTYTNEVMFRCNLWRNTNAISTLTVAPDVGSNFASGSTFNLYGILAGNA